MVLIYGHYDRQLQIMDMAAATDRATIYKNHVHTSTITAVHNLTSDDQNIAYLMM